MTDTPEPEHKQLDENKQYVGEGNNSTRGVNGSLDEKPESTFEEAQAVNAEPHATPDMRAVTTWQPEDTANFLAAAIREAQRPYTEAIKRRGVPSGIVAMVIIVFLIFIAGLYYQILRTDQRLQEATSTAAEATDTARNAELKAERKSLPMMAELEGLKIRVKQEAAHAFDANQEAEKIQREKLELHEQLVAERLRYEKTEQDLTAASEGVEELSAKLKALEDERSSLANARSQIDNAVMKAEKSRQAAILLQEQIDAQADAEVALRKQLEAARKLVKALQSEEEPASEEEAASKTE